MLNKYEFQNQLIGWYEKEARDLPWRADPTPYKVWISEMMLQQTRVDTVIPYFERFINELPGVRELAAVDDDKLLKLWQGLGYYNRALNLKKAARIIVQEYHGEIPSDPGALQSLPGIGAYSAGAIASIAFGRKIPAVDGNVLRVMARIKASREDIGDPKTRRETTEAVTEILPDLKPGDFNQALMDLGATICLPNGEPRCAECPVNGLCLAYQKDLTAEIPLKSNKKERKIEKKTVLVVSWNGRYALRKRSGEGLLPNLWEFPNREGYLTKDQCKALLQEAGINVGEMTALKSSKHIFTHLEWHMKGFLIVASEVHASTDLVWATKEEIRRLYSVPTAFKGFLSVL